MNFEFNDVELFFLKRALEWRIQNIDWFIQKKHLEGLKKANQLSEKATLVMVVKKIDEFFANKEAAAAAEEEDEQPDPMKASISDEYNKDPNEELEPEPAE